MTKKKKTKAAKPPVVRKGHTMADAILTIYDDMEIAKGVQMLSEAGNAVLVSAGGALMLLHKKVADFINEHIAKKAESIPPENRQPPDPTTTAKVIPALNAVFGEENLREMFLNLLAATMDKTKAGNIAPAFVEVIRQLSPDEALILRRIAEMNLFVFPLVDICATGFDYRGTGDLGAHGGYQPVLRDHANLVWLAGCKYEENESVYIANMSRLGLFEVDNRTIPADAEEIYEALSNDPVTAPIKREIVEKGQRVHIIKKSGQFTEFGKAFCKHAIGEFPAKDTTR